MQALKSYGALALLALGQVEAANTTWTFTAYTDGQCQKPLSASNSTFIATQGFPSFTTLQQPTFPGAEAEQGSGGWDVWWSIPQPPPGCRSMLMLPFTQSSGTAGLPGGREIINVGSAGCYFGNVPTDSDVLLSYCCGSNDCTAAGLNDTSLLPAPTRKRNRVPPSLGARKVTPVDLPIPRPEQPPTPEPKGRSMTAPAGSLATHDTEKRWYYPQPSPNPACQIQPGQPYSRAGRQIVVSPSQDCADAPCSVAVSQQVSFSTTATSSTSQTITNSVGGSISVDAGIDFIVKADTTTTFTYSWDKAVEQATGQSVMEGNSTTVTNTITLKHGNQGAITFTPTYKCVTGPISCGAGLSDPIDFCQPDLSGPGGTINGDFTPIVFG